MESNLTIFTSHRKRLYGEGLDVMIENFNLFDERGNILEMIR
jgi:hypothetical protein